jgi:hypothetical protein
MVLLADSSVWIHYLGYTRTRTTEQLSQLIEDKADLVTTEPVVMELLAVGDTAARSGTRAARERVAGSLGGSPVDFRSAATHLPGGPMHGQDASEPGGLSHCSSGRAPRCRAGAQRRRLRRRRRLLAAARPRAPLSTLTGSATR